MKKFVGFVVLAIVVIGSCAVNAGNDARKFVGTWVQESGSITYVFNANGTGTASGRSYSGENGNIFWGVSTSGALFIILADNDTTGGTYYFSPDGRRMLFNGGVYQRR